MLTSARTKPWSFGDSMDEAMKYQNEIVANPPPSAWAWSDAGYIIRLRAIEHTQVGTSRFVESPQLCLRFLPSSEVLKKKLRDEMLLFWLRQIWR
jgi:hypothetical protein